MTTPLTWDSALQKLVGAGCTRKDAGEYIAFSCKGSKLLFVLSAPTSPAHAAMTFAETDPSGQTIFARFTRIFFDRSRPQTEEWRAAFSKWERGLEYLPASQLR